MNKRIYIIAGILIIAGVIVFSFGKREKQQSAPTTIPQTQEVAQTRSFDGRNSTITIDGKSVTLTNGTSVVAIPGSSSAITTRYFGNEAWGDLSGDGLDDEAFLVTQDMGGSGLFYYAVAAITTPTGYKTTNAFFIGDRIAPQATVIPAGSMQIDVNYAERKPGEPMTAQPSIGVTKVLKVTQDGTLESVPE